MTTSPLGLHRVTEPPGVLPQAARRLDASPAIAPDEVRIRVDRLNLDAASYRQIREAYVGDADKIRAAVLDIIATRGKMQNPVTGSGGMLTGTVDEVGPRSPLGLKPGQRVATLVSLTLTPLAITDQLAQWDGQSEQVPCEGHAILFARSIAAVLPDDLPAVLSLAVLDVCGAPGRTAPGRRRRAAARGQDGPGPRDGGARQGNGARLHLLHPLRPGQPPCRPRCGDRGRTGVPGPAGRRGEPADPFGAGPQAGRGRRLHRHRRAHGRHRRDPQRQGARGGEGPGILPPDPGGEHGVAGQRAGPGGQGGPGGWGPPGEGAT